MSAYNQCRRFRGFASVLKVSTAKQHLFAGTLFRVCQCVRTCSPRVSPLCWFVRSWQLSKAMVLAALLFALGGVWADAYETPANMVAVLDRPSLRNGGPRVDSGHATIPLRCWHALEPGPLFMDPAGSDVFNAARVGGSRSAGTADRSGTAADEANYECPDTTRCAAFFCANQGSS